MLEQEQSALGEFRESPLAERLHSTNPPLIERKVLHQEKVFPGRRAFTWREVSDALSLVYFGGPYPTLAKLRDARRHFKKQTTVFSGTAVGFDPVPTSYNAVDELVGLGDAPTTNGGWPASWSYDAVPQGSATTCFPYGPSYPFPPTPEAYSITATRRRWTQGADPTWLTGQLTESLSNEVLAQPYIVKCCERIKERTFAEVLSWRNDLSAGSAEVFDEWRGSTLYSAESVADPNVYTGDPMSADVGDLLSVYGLAAWMKQDLEPTQNSRFFPLVSYWLYPDAYQQKEVIEAERLLFRITNLAASYSYFIGRGVFYMDYPVGQDVQIKLHPVVQILEEGTADSLEEIEVPLPYRSRTAEAAGPNFNFDDFLELYGTRLTLGCVSFAILNESPRDWATRKGFTISGSADSDIITVDSDWGTADDDDTIP